VTGKRPDILPEPPHDYWPAQLATVEAERDQLWAEFNAVLTEANRLREALERIAAQDTRLTPGWKHWREIAREALDA